MTGTISSLPELGSYVLARLDALLRMPLNPDADIYWVYLLAVPVLAAVSYRLHQRPSGMPWRQFASFCLPARIYLHPSARVDYQIFLANALVVPSLGILAGGLTAKIAVWVAATLADSLGRPTEIMPFGTLTFLSVTLVLAALTDLRAFVVHYLHHRVPLLWEFHRVHHSAEVLTPLSSYRKHPFYDTFGPLVYAPFDALLHGIAVYVFFGQLDVMTLFGSNAVVTAFRLFGANLRHSHIWLSWGPVLNHVLISPAQHQIHHSVAHRHRDRNYGEIFAIWDLAIGTLYVPREREDLVFGIAGDAPQEHPSLLAAYWLPLQNAARIARRSFRDPAASPKRKAFVSRAESSSRGPQGLKRRSR